MRREGFLSNSPGGMYYGLNACALRIFENPLHFLVHRSYVDSSTRRNQSSNGTKALACLHSNSSSNSGHVMYVLRLRRLFCTGRQPRWTAVPLPPPNLGTGDDNAYPQGRSWVKPPLKHVYDIKSCVWRILILTKILFLAIYYTHLVLLAWLRSLLSYTCCTIQKPANMWYVDLDY